MELEHPMRLRSTDDLRRSRLTVFFRLLLVVPHLVWWYLWSFAAFLIVILNWFATLQQGRSPEGLHDILAGYVRYLTHVYAYMYLVADPYPGFRGREGSYPIDLQIDPPAPQARWATFFRLPLGIPAWILATVFGYVALVVAFFAWFVCLALGRIPVGMRDLMAYCLRYQAQTYGFSLLLTARYPSLSAAPVRNYDLPPAV